MRMTIRKAVLPLALAALGTTLAAGPASAATNAPGSDAQRPKPYSLTSAARSVKTTFFNDSNCTFINYNAWLYHGIWSI